LEDIFLVIVFLEHMCFVVLGVTGTEGQETERFLGDRKSARLLVGWEDFVVSLWESGEKKECLEASSYYLQDYIANGHLQQTMEEVFC
jgi:hypothetical protein